MWPSTIQGTESFTKWLIISWWTNYQPKHKTLADHGATLEESSALFDFSEGSQLSHISIDILFVLSDLKPVATDLLSDGGLCRSEWCSIAALDHLRNNTTLSVLLGRSTSSNNKEDCSTRHESCDNSSDGDTGFCPSAETSGSRLSNWCCCRLNRGRIRWRGDCLNCARWCCNLEFGRCDIETWDLEGESGCLDESLFLCQLLQPSTHRWGTYYVCTCVEGLILVTVVGPVLHLNGSIWASNYCTRCSRNAVALVSWFKFFDISLNWAEIGLGFWVYDLSTKVMLMNGDQLTISIRNTKSNIICIISDGEGNRRSSYTQSVLANRGVTEYRYIQPRGKSVLLPWETLLPQGPMLSICALHGRSAGHKKATGPITDPCAL